MLYCETKVMVLNSYSKVANNGKTYYHLNVAPVSGGESNDIGCSEDVFNEVKQGGKYICHFDINPYFLRKEYSTSIIVKEVEIIK